jgi:ribonucleoside-triphosphate reductase
VYSRITGYYRPVQNWNAGKTEEYYSRKLYDVPRSNLPEEKRHTKNAQKGRSVSAINGTVYLFTSRTCPNCRIVKRLLDDANMTYSIVDAAERPDLVGDFDVRHVPTLIVLGDGASARYINASQIKQYLDTQKNGELAAVQ